MADARSARLHHQRQISLSKREWLGVAGAALTLHRGFTMLRHFSEVVAERVFHEGRRR
jgi:hypothetical protein